jgi:uncharacterized membrane protein YeiH
MSTAAWLHGLDLAGVAVFAASGALAAGRKSLDLFGVFIIAAVTAIGGGTTRDLLLDRHPIFWLNDPAYLVTIVLAAGATVLVVRRRPAAASPGRPLLVADALGLALFTITGTRLACEAALPLPACALLGMMTGVLGGVFRDVLSGEVPLILRRDLYATAALAGSLSYLAAQGLPRPVPSLLGLGVVLLLRALAILRGWRLPIFRLPEEPR